MSATQGADFFVSGGTLSLDSASYVERDCDLQLFEALLAGKYSYVLNPRQMGKSSLSVRTLAKLEAAGHRAVSVDLTQMGGRNVTAEQWYIGLAVEIGRALGLRAEVLAYCRERSEFGPMRRFFGVLRDVVLEKIDAPVVICIDEIDATRNLSFDPDEFFAGIRECFNHRVFDPKFQRLTFCLIGVAIASDLIRNASTTPFNIGERVYLRDFSREEVLRFAPALGGKGATLVDRIHYWTNGHPFLTQSLCAACAADPGVQTPAQVDALVETNLFGPKARDRNINLADVANRALNSGASESDPERFRADLLSMYDQVLTRGKVGDDEANRVASLLGLSGLVTSDGRFLRPRNRIYQQVFNRTWVRENMPGQEIRRQQQSFRRGLLRATFASAAILALVGTLGIVAWNAKLTAVGAEKALNRELYVADMNSLRAFEEDGDVARIEDVLEHTRTSPYRGFEWSFWMRRIHDAAEEYTLDYFAPGKRERGVLSWDDKQICLWDDVALTAAVVDRATKHIVATRTTEPQQEIVATEAGFAVVDGRSSPCTSTDLLTGNILAHFGNPASSVNGVVTRPHSEFAIVRQHLPPTSEAETISLWNIRTGKQIFAIANDSRKRNTFANFSSDGRRLLMGVLPTGPAGTGGMVTVYDTTNGKAIDQFPFKETASILDLSDSGSQVIYSDGGPTVLGRDVDRHAIVYRYAWSNPENPTAVSFVGAERRLCLLDQSGKVTLTNYPQGQFLGARYNVWNLSTSRQGADLLASATSVRIFDTRREPSAGFLDTGERVGRDGLGHIVLFKFDPHFIRRLVDPTLAPGGAMPIPKNFRSFTYNGRWQMTVQRERKIARIVDTEEKGKPVVLTPIPSNFSAGLSGETFAISSQIDGTVQGISGATGQSLWKYVLPNSQSSGLWMSPDSKTVLALSGRFNIEVLDAKTGQLRGTISPHNLGITSVSFTSDNKGFFTYGRDGRAILWDLYPLKERREFRASAGMRVTGADLSPDGRQVATTTEGGIWQVWDAATGVQLTTVKALDGPLRGILFTCDGRHLITVSASHIIRTWDSIDQDPSLRVPIGPSALRGIRR